MTKARLGSSALVAAGLLISSPGRGALGDDHLPLCPVAASAEEGAHHQAVVSAILVGGRENTFLYYPQCENGRPMTWVDFELKAMANKSRLDRILKKSGRALVVLDGEIWGPRASDLHSPEMVRQMSPKGWGHLSAYRTRFVVRSILKIEPVPEDVPFYQWPKVEAPEKKQP
ncbi:MAG: hypothetical protein ABJC51_00640 [Acidobacteriota bacterium]